MTADSAVPAGDQATTTGLHLEILTPEDVLFEGDVDWIEAPLQDGLVGIWPGHAPLIGALATGDLRYSQSAKEHSQPISGGVLRVGVERCAVLLSREAAASATQGDEIASQVVEAIDQDLGTDVAEALSIERQPTDAEA